ncbi:MAG: flagellar motor switch protein FliG [Thermodesulfobacteriota bacterium]|nr:flagellar motor switch protein FliG [Thermodesulfobacteriota bacterium]
MSDLSGAQKAAIIIHKIGMENANEIVRELDDKNIRKISRLLSQKWHFSSKEYEDVMDEFIQNFTSGTGISVGGQEYIKEFLLKVFGQNKAEAILEQLEIFGDSTPFAAIDKLDSRALAHYIRTEHPQTIAVILSYLKPEKAAKMLNELPEETQPDVILRMATLDKVTPELVYEIEEVLVREIKSEDRSFDESKRPVGGTQPIAEILNNVDRATESNIIKKIEELNPSVADEIKQLMFLFEDLINIDDKGIQSILKEISKENLALSLKNASAELKEKIFKNMSSRATEMLMEDMESLGPVRVKDVEKAQQTVIKIAKQLEEKGEVFLSQGKDEIIE